MLETGLPWLLAIYLAIGFIIVVRLDEPVNMRHSPAYWAILLASFAVLLVAWPIIFAGRFRRAR